MPRSFALLLPALANDASLRERFFSRLQFAFSAAAALPRTLAESFAALAGATETAPGATCVHALGVPYESIGVPLPGVEIALARVEGGSELRVRGPGVTPGY